MANQQMVDWIRRESAGGQTRQQLYDILIRRRYDKNEIERALDEVFHPCHKPYSVKSETQ